MNPAARNRLTDFIAGRTASEVATAIVDEPPWFFTARDVSFAEWATRVAQRARLGGNIHLVGSGATGISLNPDNLGRPFRQRGGPQRPSDLDVAIVDVSLFVGLWNELVAADRERQIGGTLETRKRMRVGVFHGHVSEWHLRRGTPAARLLRTTKDAVSRDSVVRGHTVTVRVYRRREDLLAYQITGVQQALSMLERPQ